MIVSLQGQESPPPSQAPHLLKKLQRLARRLLCKSEEWGCVCVLFLFLPQFVLSQTLRPAGLVLQQAAEQNGLWLMIDPWETSSLPSWEAVKGGQCQGPGRERRIRCQPESGALTQS